LKDLKFIFNFIYFVLYYYCLYDVWIDNKVKFSLIFIIIFIIIKVKDKSAVIVELTIRHETNLRSSEMYKENKYKDLNEFKTGSITDNDLILTTCELSVLGSCSLIIQFCKIYLFQSLMRPYSISFPKLSFNHFLISILTEMLKICSC